MAKILFIVPMPFHNKSNNAGAKVINYYIKRFSCDHDVTVLLTHWQKDENVTQMIKECPNITFITSFKKKNLINRFIDGIFKYKFLYKILFKFNPIYYRTNGVFKSRLINLLNLVETPDFFDNVIVEFPPLVLQSDLIKKRFPHSKIVASVHDISFQSLERSINTHKIWISEKIYLKKFKEFELSHLKNYDLIVALSDKDKRLLENEKIASNQILTISPFFDVYKYEKIEPDGIFFFGALNRKENINSINWFLDNVWKNIANDHFPDLKFYILGGGLTNNFKKHCESYKNIILTGFIEDPTPYFNKCYAMVVPLQYGAGIKIKSIEALASGIPLISNQIGIEGIPAINGEHYLNCETPQEWTMSITSVIKDNTLSKKMIDNGNSFINKFFDLEKSYRNYSNISSKTYI